MTVSAYEEERRALHTELHALRRQHGYHMFLRPFPPNHPAYERQQEIVRRQEELHELMKAAK